MHTALPSVLPKVFFAAVKTTTQPCRFQTKKGSEVFPNYSGLGARKRQSRGNARCKRSKGEFIFKPKCSSVNVAFVSSNTNVGGSRLADSWCASSIPNVLERVKVRAVCRPVNFFHAKLGKIFLYGVGLGKGQTNC